MILKGQQNITQLLSNDEPHTKILSSIVPPNNIFVNFLSHTYLTMTSHFLNHKKIIIKDSKNNHIPNFTILA